MEYSLWPACVKTHSYAQQLAATREAGFTHLPIGGFTISQLLQSQSLNDIRSQALDAGVQLGHYDGFTDWAPIRFDPSLPEAAQAVFDFSAEQCLEYCNQLGLKSICATGAFLLGQFSANQLSDGFAAFCLKAAQYNIRVDLEFIPMWGVANLNLAWRIVQASGAENAGILFDTWHFLRGDADFTALDQLPCDAITCVQLADAADSTKQMPLMEDCLGYRRPPGEGDLPLGRVGKILRKQVRVHSVGPEVFSKELDLLDAEQAARRVAKACQATFPEYDWPAAAD